MDWTGRNDEMNGRIDGRTDGWMEADADGAAT